MRYIAAIAAIFTALPAVAADKGAPATLDQILAMEPFKRPVACYVEASATGVSLKDDREAQGGLGGGCDLTLANLVLGGGIRADFADWRNNGSIFMKFGVAINQGANAYLIGEWKVPEWKVDKAGQLMIGGGADIRLSIINDRLRAFGEVTTEASKFGALADKHEWNGRIGFKLDLN